MYGGEALSYIPHTCTPQPTTASPTFGVVTPSSWHPTARFSPPSRLQYRLFASILATRSGLPIHCQIAYLASTPYSTSMGPRSHPPHENEAKKQPTQIQWRRSIITRPTPFPQVHDSPSIPPKTHPLPSQATPSQDSPLRARCCARLTQRLRWEKRANLFLSLFFVLPGGVSFGGIDTLDSCPLVR
jgi:hypothetical protein